MLKTLENLICGLRENAWQHGPAEHEQGVRVVAEYEERICERIIPLFYYPVLCCAEHRAIIRKHIVGCSIWRRFDLRRLDSQKERG